jgi:hypothetical protein
MLVDDPETRYVGVDYTRDYRPARQVYDQGTGAWVGKLASASSRHNTAAYFGSEVPEDLALS